MKLSLCTRSLVLDICIYIYIPVKCLTRNKRLLVAPGLTARSKKLLGASTIL